MLEKHPGYLGYGGIIAIHADWPNYPPGIGWEIALKALGNFPENTQFHEISDIDRCKLLINQPPSDLKDPFNEKYYHTAIWHSDLVKLKEKGLIHGVEEKSEYEFELINFNNLKKELGSNFRVGANGDLYFHIKEKNGNLKELKCTKPDYEEDHWLFKECAIIPSTISLTPKGLKKLKQLSKNLNLSKTLHNLTDPLINIKRFDTAVREASLLIESCLKNFHNTNSYGQKLIELHINDVVKQNENNYSAIIKCYRSELRTIFKFIRNDFAHNFKVLSEEQCRVILQRIDQSYIEFKEVTNVYYNN